MGSKVKGMVLSWPLRVVAANVMEWDCKSGRRKVDVQPAPRMRMSTDEGSGGGGVVGVVSCVIIYLVDDPNWNWFGIDMDFFYYGRSKSIIWCEGEILI